MSLRRSAEQAVLGPVVSEKSYSAMASGRYAFRCAPWATKIEIGRAVEELFAAQKITVTRVTTQNVAGKARRRSRGRTRVTGKSPDWKKAVVTLAAGQKIDGLFEGV
ncbi:MAG: 50S ribosomal protein L23 [Candidatus Dormibacteria bacterium]